MAYRSTSNQVRGLIACVALSFGAAALGAIASRYAPEFYAQLSRPTWAPPATWFGPVWTVLYLLIAIAGWLVWREPNQRRRTKALRLFVAQLIFNALWSWFFFAWRLGAVAFADIVVLVILIVATVSAFWRIRRFASLLLLPYLAWVCFATALTWAVWQRNPSLL